MREDLVHLVTLVRVDQRDRLRREADATKISMAQRLRELIDRMFADEDKKKPKA